MTSIKRYLGEPQDARWLNQLSRLLTAAGFGSAEEQPKQLSGWDVLASARADKLPGEPELQVVTIYSFDHFGVQRISSVVFAVNKVVEAKIIERLTRAGFAPYGSPDGMSITKRLAHAGFSGKDRLGHDLVHPQLLNSATAL